MRDFSRQTDLVPMDLLHATPVSVVGVGAVGRNVAVQLASVGVKAIDLFDFDEVDESNVTTQGYWTEQVGMPKVEAAEEAVLQVDPEIVVVKHNDRWRSKDRLKGVVFCCVDNMDSRKMIFEGVQRTASFFCDGRMQGLAAYCYPFAKEYFHKYLDTWHPQEESEPGRCTARSTLFVASFLASAMIFSMTRWMAGKKVYPFGGMPCEFCKL